MPLFLFQLVFTDFTLITKSNINNINETSTVPIYYLAKIEKKIEQKYFKITNLFLACSFDGKYKNEHRLCYARLTHSPLSLVHNVHFVTKLSKKKNNF